MLISHLAPPSSIFPIPSRNCVVSAASDLSSQLVVPFGTCTNLAASDTSSQLAVPSRNYASLVASDPNSLLAVPSRNFSVLVDSLRGSSQKKLCNPCLLTTHAIPPVPLENHANLVVQHLLTVRFGKCVEHALPALLKPWLSLLKFVQFCLPAEPDLADSHCRIRSSISIPQWLLHNFHHQFPGAIIPHHNLPASLGQPHLNDHVSC